MRSICTMCSDFNFMLMFSSVLLWSYLSTPSIARFMRIETVNCWLSDCISLGPAWVSPSAFCMMRVLIGMDSHAGVVGHGNRCTWSQSSGLVLVCVVLVLGFYIHHALLNEYISTRDDSRLSPSQWETSLQRNTVSYWLGTNLESAPSMAVAATYHSLWDIQCL